MEVSQRIHTYQPHPDTVERIQAMRFLFLVGITSAGKDTVQKKLLARNEFEKIVTSVTRQPRSNNGVLEQHGREYYFLTYEQAYEKVLSHQYFEVALVHERIYGATTEELERIYALNKIAMADVDYQGVDYYSKYFDNVTAVCLMPPSYEVWLERARTRYATQEEYEEQWPERIESARRELEWMLTGDRFFAVNDDIERVSEYVYGLEKGAVSEEEQRRGRHIAQDILTRIS